MAFSKAFWEFPENRGLSCVRLYIARAGLYDSIFAREATNKGYKVLVIDKRNNVGGGLYDMDATVASVLEKCKKGFCGNV